MVLKAILPVFSVDSFSRYDKKMTHSNNNPITPLAITNYRDIRKAFGIKERNRRHHMYIIGKTGTGKSTLIKNMMISDVKAGNGMALLDPHGDLAEDLLDYIPKERINDVIYFNPADLKYPIPFNPLECVHQGYHHLVASGLISSFKKAWPDFWGPRLEHILRYTILTLLEYPDSTLLLIPRLLTDKAFRQQVIRYVHNPQVKEFWEMEYNKYNAVMRYQAIAPILNKVGQFLASPLLRNIVGQTRNTFRFRKVMDEGKIFIANLSKGKIGEDNCSLLGSMLITRMQLAAMSRTDLPEEKRRGFYLYVDEFHNFLTLSFADILSEARKYGLSLILAHQFLSQLDPMLQAAILGNTGTLVCFRIGYLDAKQLADELKPVFTCTDLTNLPNFQIYLKLLIDGKTSQPFSASTLPIQKQKEGYKQDLIDQNRKNYRP